MQTEQQCGNCGLEESATPRRPEEGECACSAWNDWSLNQERKRRLVAQTQTYLRACDALAPYAIARLDLSGRSRARAALRILAQESNKILDGISTAKPVDLGDWCMDCDGVGILPPIEGIVSFCEECE